MKNKRNRSIIYLITSIVSIGLIILPGINYEIVSILGTPYNIKIQGYDPYDPIRGRYILFNIDTSNIKTDEKIGEGNSQKCYITLKQENDGFWILDRAYLKKPSDSPYIESYLYEQYDGTHSYTTPFTNYYISEKIADKADEIVRNEILNAYVQVKVLNGTGITSAMYIGNQSIEDLAS